MTSATTPAGKSFAALLAKTLEEDGLTAMAMRLHGLDPVQMRTTLVAAIERLNPQGRPGSVLLGDVMAVYAAVRKDVKSGVIGKAHAASEIGKRTVTLLQLDAPGLGTDALGRVIRAVCTQRLNAREEARKNGDIRRVATHVGLAMEHLGPARRLAAENAVLDHQITHDKMVQFVNSGQTSSLFYGPEIRSSAQTPDLELWCEALIDMVDCADYIAEAEASGNDDDYKDGKSQRDSESD